MFLRTISSPTRSQSGSFSVRSEVITPPSPSGCRVWAATEAPRGTLYHRYRLESDGKIAEAQIVPPTSQNQTRIEADLTAFLPDRLEYEDERTRRPVSGREGGAAHESWRRPVDTDRPERWTSSSAPASEHGLQPLKALDPVCQVRR